MRTLTFVFFIMLLLAFSTNAQNVLCGKTAASVTIRGFNIGMTERQALKLYPKLPIQHPDEKLGESIVNMNPNVPADDQLGPAGKGLTELSLLFLDGKLARAEFGYENVADWKQVSEFTTAVGSLLGLPSADQWRPLASKMNERLRLDCRDISFITYVEYRAGRYESSWPSLTMRTLTFDEDAKRKTEDAADAKRRAFKP